MGRRGSCNGTAGRTVCTTNFTRGVKNRNTPVNIAVRELEKENYLLKLENSNLQACQNSLSLKGKARKKY
jgi:hypothetical protein